MTEQSEYRKNLGNTEAVEERKKRKREIYFP